MVFQGSMNGFTPVFTIGSQMKEVFHVHGHEGTDEAVRKLLAMVNLDESIARRYPHELSGGSEAEGIHCHGARAGTRNSCS